MFVVLDTNHFRELTENSGVGRNLARRIEEHGADVFTCIVVLEETLQGWFALLKRRKTGRDQLEVYARLQRDAEALSRLVMLPFDDQAAKVFHRLQPDHRRTGTMDLKIAAICIAHDATLLTRNIRDFEGIAGLNMANWLD